MLGGLLRCAIIIILVVNSALTHASSNKLRSVSCFGERRTISQIQGEGKRSPFVSKTSDNTYRSQQLFTVQGVVTKLKHGRDSGFYMQQTTTSQLSLASQGIFVSTRHIAGLKLNSRVCVTGKVLEYYGMTRLLVNSDVNVLEPTVIVPSIDASKITLPPTDILIATADRDFSETLERYEGMKVRIIASNDMRVTKPLYYDRRWKTHSIIASHQRINIHPNTYAIPGSINADQHALENKQRRLYLQFPTGQFLTSKRGELKLDDMRVNDRISGVVGILTYRYGEFRLLVETGLSEPLFTRLNRRESLPKRTEPYLRIASFNLLNYFNRVAGGAHNPLKHNRGAKTLAELKHQEVQLRDTILSLDADFIGLMEVENNGYGKDSAIRRLLILINSQIKDPSKQYKMLRPRKADLHKGKYLGTGAITVAGFYRSAKLKVVNTRVIQLPVQRSILGNAYHRPALTTTFMRLDNRQEDKRLTISVNHFKSKGSKCFEDKQRTAMLKKLKKNSNTDNQSRLEWRRVKHRLDEDRQGHCAEFRASAATVLANALASESGSTIILGDLNSYPKEDALLVLTDYQPARYAYYKIDQSEHNYLDKTLLDIKTVKGFGYYDPFTQQPDNNWTYSFKDLGRLDYILLGSDLVSSLVSKKAWHINAAESRLLHLGADDVGYMAHYLGSKVNKSAIFSSSDHDPVFIELK